ATCWIAPPGAHHHADQQYSVRPGRGEWHDRGRIAILICSSPSPDRHRVVSHTVPPEPPHIHRELGDRMHWSWSCTAPMQHTSSGTSEIQIVNHTVNGIAFVAAELQWPSRNNRIA